MKSLQKVLLGFFLVLLVVSGCQNPIADVDSANSRAVTTAINRPPSVNPPFGLTPAQVPQFVAFGWDDNGKSESMNWAIDMAAARTNPAGTGNVDTFDGTPVTMTFFNTSYYIDKWGSESPVYVKKAWRDAYEAGHEIGNHSASHPHGKAYTSAQWEAEINECNDWLTAAFDPNEVVHSPGASGVGIPLEEIKGFRTPYLEYGDPLFPVLYAKGMYDTSIEEGYQVDQDGTNFLWPYTLDNGAPGHDVQVAWGTREPLGNYPGMWELPVYTFIVPQALRPTLKARVSWFDEAGGKITGFDYNMWISFSLTKDEFVQIMKHTLDLRLASNKAPMLIGVHTDYYVESYKTPGATHLERRAAIEEFMDYALSKPEVRIVSFGQILDWLIDGKVTPMETVTVTTSAGANGTISPLGANVVKKNSTFNFTITADPGYKLDRLYINNVPQELPISESITASADTKIHATFMVGDACDAVDYVHGNSYSGGAIVCVDGKHYKAKWWTQNEVPPGTSGVWEYVEDCPDTIVVNPVPVTITAGANGTADPIGTIQATAPVTVNFIPNAGYEVANVTVNNVSIGAVSSTVVELTDTAMAVNVTFQKIIVIERNIVATAGANGSITPAGTSVVVDGDSISYTIAAYTGYEIADVLVDNVSVGAVSSYTFTNVTADHTISASFVKETPKPEYTISVGTESHIVKEGESITIIIPPPQPGYEIADVTIDGISVGAVAEYTFTNVTANHSVQVSYVKIPTFDVTATAGANGSITPSGVQTVERDTVLTFTIAADAGFQIADVTVNGVSKGAVADLTIEVTETTLIEATFTESPGYPEWSPNSVAYALGDMVTYQGVVYECKYAHTSNSAWVPGTPGLWLWEAAQ